MKKATIALVLTVVAFAATSAFAQSHFTLRADVPMGFAADGQQYPAGQYELRSNNANTILLCNITTGEAFLIRAINDDQIKSGSNGVTPVLRFAVSGKRAYLMSLTDHQGNAWKVHVADRDLEAARKSGSKVEVALK